MTELDDHELLAAYARTESESAFATLVARHVNLVHSAALRFTGNPHHAGEISQAVFILLARKAGGLSRHVVVSGWLYETARLTAANFMKGEIRRQQREQEAYMQSTLNEPADAGWQQIAPLLDEAMGRLGETDRNALVLRYFENKSVVQIAKALRLNEATAHKRASRALEKLRKFFTKRGLTLSAAALASAVSTNAVSAAPVGLATTISAIAATQGASAVGSTTTLVKGTLKLMAWTKAKLAIVVGVSVLLAAGTTTVVVEKVRTPAVDESFWEVTLDNLDRAPAVVLIRPARYADYKSATDEDGRAIAHNMNFAGLLEWAYSIRPIRMILPDGFPRGQYELMLTLRDHPQAALQKALQRQFGIVCRRETRETNVLFLAIKDPGLLARHVNTSGKTTSYEQTGNNRIWKNSSITSVTKYLEGQAFDRPVVVQTGLEDRYDITFPPGSPEDNANTDFETRLRRSATAGLAQAGLELVPTNLPIEMLVVDKVK